MIELIKNWFGVSRTFGVQRSSSWASVRNNFIKRNPLCAVCGKKGTLFKPNEAHHIILFSQDQTKELDPQNLITFCREHHYEWGHYFSWKSWSANVRQEVADFRKRVDARP